MDVSNMVRDYSYRDKKWLNLQYNVFDKSPKQLASMCGVKEETIIIWLKKFEMIDVQCEICKKIVNKVKGITDHRNVKYEKACNVCIDAIKQTIRMRNQRKSRVYR